MTGHASQGAGLELDVGVRDEDRLCPGVGEDLFQPLVERMCLALAADARPDVDHSTRVRSDALLDGRRRAVGAGVIDDHDPQALRWVVHAQQPVDRGADDRLLVPRRDEDGGTRQVRSAPSEVVADPV